MRKWKVFIHKKQYKMQPVYVYILKTPEENIY